MLRDDYECLGKPMSSKSGPGMPKEAYECLIMVMYAYGCLLMPTVLDKIVGRLSYAIFTINGQPAKFCQFGKAT